MGIKKTAETIGNFSPAIISSIVTIILLIGTVLTYRAERSKILDQERLKALSNIGIIRANIEGALNSRLLLGKGLATYLRIKPELNAEEFRNFTEKLFSNDPVIRNISVIKGTVIAYAYPLETNKKAIGVDLAKIPAQKEDLFKAITTKKTVFSSNVNLVQGGTATITRIPVFLNNDVYWGQISLVLMQDELFKESNLADGAFGMKYSLTAEGKNGTYDKQLFGNAEIFGKNPVTLEITHSFGHWKLQAVPVYGWGNSDSKSIKSLAIGSVLSILIGSLVYLFTYTRRRIHHLESILPLCSSCKKIKNDTGDWSSVEAYFSKRSDIQFSHGLCQECAEKMYGNEEWYPKDSKKD